MESIFELAGNLCLILTKLDLEHGLAQPQLVDTFGCLVLTLIYVDYVMVMVMVMVNVANQPFCT